MIIHRMVVHNFGIFLGRHELDLRPTPEQPVVLIGAMNGSGKTTLLEALKLVLYGRRSIDITRGTGSYEEFLRDSINREALPASGAAVEAEFSLLVAGKESIHRIIRSWVATASVVKETLEVYVDSVFDPVLTDGWNEHVESILPIRLAPFFFFDGEQLETLADPGKSREFLANAIQALLGLDIVDRLSEDLRSVERRIKEGSVETLADQAELTILRRQSELHDREVAHLVQRCGELMNAVDQAKRSCEVSRRQLMAVSGDLPVRLRSLEAQRVSLVTRKADGMAMLMTLAYEAGPFTLLLDGIESALDAASSRGLNAALLAQRDERVLAALKRKRIPVETIARINEVLELDRKTMGDQPPTGMQSADRDMLSDSLQQGRYAQEAATMTLRALDRYDAELAQVDAQIAALPTEQSLEPLQRAVAEKESVLLFSEAEYRVASEALERARRQRDKSEESIQGIITTAMEKAKQRRYASHLLQRSHVFRETLESFRVHMAARHAAKLGDTILESFQCLHRKSGTVEKIVVDSKAFEMVLYDAEGRRVDASRLSAGERQLLAVAMVWSILKAAGRPVPLWIDTPLGRLDSVHRRHLIERFFPFAAHQVVLFSTDTEIDHRAEELMRPFIARSYRIEFDPETRTSACEEGYFLGKAA